MTGYDIIGDIHGHADTLTALLERLGYVRRSGVWRHPERSVVFLGDFIDRGPRQEQVLETVRAMCEAGVAQAVMGNHEYNAVCFATEDPQCRGEYLRPHSEKNLKQHHSFLEQVGAWSENHRDWVQWFRTLPLWMEFDGFRVIHACWHPDHQTALSPWLDGENRLSDEGFVATAARGSKPFEALETLLKGLEVPLPEGYGFRDKDDHPRSEVRVRWWEGGEQTYREGAIIDEHIRARLPAIAMPPHARLNYEGDRPVFVGHYWMRGTPAPQAERVACLDYSIAKGDTDRKLCAYRWQGEIALKREHFVWVEG